MILLLLIIDVRGNLVSRPYNVMLSILTDFFFFFKSELEFLVHEHVRILLLVKKIK